MSCQTRLLESDCGKLRPLTPELPLSQVWVEAVGLTCARRSVQLVLPVWPGSKCQELFHPLSVKAVGLRLLPTAVFMAEGLLLAVFSLSSKADFAKAIFCTWGAASSRGACPSEGGACSLAPPACGVMEGSDMVVALSFDAFTRNELLAGHLANGLAFLAGLSVPSLASSLKTLEWSVSKSVRSQRTSYRFVNSNTGGEVGEWLIGCIFEVVVKACPFIGGRGISECTLFKVSVCNIKESDRLTEEESSSVCKSLVIAAELSARRPTLLPPRSWCPLTVALLEPLSLHVPLPSCGGNPC